MLSHQDIVEEVGGTFKYYCYVLADFDPIKADEFFDNCSMEQVSKAMLAKLNYNRPPDE